MLRDSRVMTASPATAPRSTQRPTALVVAFMFLVALVAVAFGSIVDAHASTRPVTDAGNVVAASTVTGDHVVAPSADVPAGQRRARAPDYDQTAVGSSVAAEDAGLVARANEVHGALDPIAQNSRTTAVLGTQEGPNVIASGGRDLSPIQRALAGPNDVLGRLPGAHAEVTALDAASNAGLTPSQMAVSRAICPACQAAIEQSGGQVGSNGMWAWWPW